VLAEATAAVGGTFPDGMLSRRPVGDWTRRADHPIVRPVALLLPSPSQDVESEKFFNTV
jgi:hypothetical protein